MEKKCPFLFLPTGVEINLPPAEAQKFLTKGEACKKEACALYDTKYERCAILSLVCKRTY